MAESDRVTPSVPPGGEDDPWLGVSEELNRVVVSLHDRIALRGKLIAPASPSVCEWRDDGGEQVTACGHRSSMLPKSPTRHVVGWKVCPYCGAPLSLPTPEVQS